MPKHRGLAFSRFVAAVETDLLDRYFERLPLENRPVGWSLLNGDALVQFFRQPENADAEALVRHDFQRINDIAEDGAATLIRACTKYGVPVTGERTPEALALLLFLDYGDAFEFAWSRYLIYGSEARLSTHPMRLAAPDLSVSALGAFQDSVRAWFSSQAKGEECEVSVHEDRGELVILIRHGTYVRTQAIWKDGAVGNITLRPAIEDVIVYESDSGLVRIRAALPKDRREYLALFARHVGGDDRLAQEALAGEVYTLAPIQDGSFDFGGAGPITDVELRAAKMRLWGAADTKIEVRASDVRRSFQHDLGGLRLDSGILLAARLRFNFRFPGQRRTSATFTIEPPATAELAERKYADLIVAYLRHQGVLLR